MHYMILNSILDQRENIAKDISDMISSMEIWIMD